MGHRTFALPAEKKTLKRDAPRAQAMVEFALALPIFLLALYGLMEVGRLIFMEAAVASASREGARYSSAYGRGGGGTLYQYRDCAGIRSAAKNVGFLLGLRNQDILIGYNTGATTTFHEYCSGSGYAQAVDTTTSLSACDRVVVTVNATYQPILPLFLPLTTKAMTSTTRRTLMGTIDLNNPTSCP